MTTSSISSRFINANTIEGPLVLSVDSQKIKVELVNVTPELATQILELNKHNRNVTQTKVDQIAADMTDGRFKFNGMPIVIDDQPDLSDGQHRLLGVVKSGVTVPMLLVTGVAKDVTDTIDTLCKPRTVSDILKMKYQHDNLKNRSYIDGIATLLLIGETGHTHHNKPEIAFYADTMIDELADWAAFGKNVQAASQNVVQQKHMLRSSMAASAVGALGIHMVQAGASKEIVRDFFTRIATGLVSDTDTTNIIPALRRRQAGGILLGGSGRSQFIAMFTEFATYINAYNKWVVGETQTRIQGCQHAIRSFAGLPPVSRIGA